MPEEPTQQTEEQPGSSPAPAQPIETPSAPVEAGPVAVEPGPTADPKELMAQLEQERTAAKERLERQQSVLEQNRAKAQSERDDALAQVEALRQSVDQERLKGMSADEQKAYRASRERQELEAEQKRVAEDREVLTDTENYWKWFEAYVKEGVPSELIRDAPNFQEMHDRVIKFFKEQPQQQPAATEQPATPTGTPAVGPGDQIQPGGGVAPPLRKADQLKAEGKWRPDSPEFIEYMREQDRRQRAGVADGRLH